MAPFVDECITATCIRTGASFRGQQSEPSALPSPGLSARTSIYSWKPLFATRSANASAINRTSVHVGRQLNAKPTIRRPCYSGHHPNLRVAPGIPMKEETKPIPFRQSRKSRCTRTPSHPAHLLHHSSLPPSLNTSILIPVQLLFRERLCSDDHHDLDGDELCCFCGDFNAGEAIKCDGPDRKTEWCGLGSIRGRTLRAAGVGSCQLERL